MEIRTMTEEQQAHALKNPPEGYAVITSELICAGDMALNVVGEWVTCSNTVEVGREVETRHGICRKIVRWPKPMTEEKQEALKSLPEGYEMIDSGVVKEGDLCFARFVTWIPCDGSDVGRDAREYTGICRKVVEKPSAAEQADAEELAEELAAEELKGSCAFRTEAQRRKETPIATGFLDYFPLAIAEMARCSLQGNKQHGIEGPLKWDRSKSPDEADSCARHFMQRGTRDTDGILHTVKANWRLMALLEKELEENGSL